MDDAAEHDRDADPSRRPRRRTQPWRSPGLVILLVAPFLGEVLSTSTPPLDLLVPWILILQAALYGCGALLCRELTRRSGGLLGLCILAVAYAVYEEALIVGSWFDPQYQDRIGLGAYGRIWHTNVLLAVHLTAFHVAVSVCSSVLLVERVFPAHRDRPWVGRRGLVAAAVALLVVVPFTYGAAYRGPLGPVLVAAGLCVALVVGGLVVVPRLPRVPAARPSRPRPRLVGLVAFAGTAAHFVLVYALPHTRVPWPLAVVIVLAPVVAAVALVRRLSTTGVRGPDGLRAVTGILAFFVLLDVAVGLAGRYDLVAGALLTLLGLWWLRRRDRRDIRC